VVESTGALGNRVFPSQCPGIQAFQAYHLLVLGGCITEFVAALVDYRLAGSDSSPGRGIGWVSTLLGSTGVVGSAVGV
jgi:hypothetical protein